MIKHLRKIKLPLLLCGFFLLLMSSYGQGHLKMDRINRSHGLSSNRTSSIVKEKDGFVWIGTDNGLNRYDGFDFKVFNQQNSNLNSSSITDLLLDKNGSLWVATLNGGLNLYQPESNTFQVFKSNKQNQKALPSNNIRTLFEDSEGKLWVGSEGGLSWYEESTQSFKTYNHDKSVASSLNNDIVTSIFEDAQGHLWIGTFGGGLKKLSRTTQDLVSIQSASDIQTDFIHTLDALDEETLLVGTKGSGLLKLDKNSLKFSDFFTGDFYIKNQPSIIRTLFKDSNDIIWVGTDGNGVFKINHNETTAKIKNYVHNAQFESSLSGNAVYDVMEDENSNIWIGTAWNGVSTLNPNSNYELIFSDIKGENLTPVLSIYKDLEHLFLGLDGKGLTIYDARNKNVNLFNTRANTSIGGDYIQHIYKSSDGIIWLGTFANGLIKFDPKTQALKQYKHNPNQSNSLSFNDVRFILEDKDSNLWIATWGGGLNYFNRTTEEFTHYRKENNNPESISSDNIISMIKDGDDLWLATFGGGVNRFNTTTFKSARYRYEEEHTNSLSSDYIFSLHLDSSQNLWIGTSGGGINVLNIENNLLKRFDENEDIKYESIRGILEDDHQDIWLSTKTGIYEYNKSSENFTWYSKLAGEYTINSAFKDQNNQLFFGTTNGVLTFDPQKISKYEKQPEVVITNLKLFNKTIKVEEEGILSKHISHTKTITLEHDANVITFEFAALAFPFSKESEYAIMMEGFDENWRTIGQDRTVTYTNLPPGDYSFKVKSKQIGSSWGDKATTLHLKILKPFWLEWWAILIYILVALFILYLFRKYTIAWEKLKANLKLEQITHKKDIELYNLKQQFFTNISHDIRTPVTLILGAINRLSKSKDIQDKETLLTMKSIKKNGNQLENLVNELLDSRKFETGKLKLYVTSQNIVEYAEEVYISFKELALKKEIEFNFKANTKSCEVWFDKMQLEKVLYNLLSNAFKFTSKKGKVEFLITEKEDKVEIQINDKGVGLGKNQLEKIFNRYYQANNNQLNDKGYGLGLSISKEIIEQHFGTISASSIKGQGTQFTIQLKKGNSHFDENQIQNTEANEDYFSNHYTKEQAEPLSEPSQDQEENSDRKSILVVEDNLEINRYISETLKDEFIILNAANGKEALELTTKHDVDVIISDIMMPVMDGLSLTKELKSNMRTSHIPVLLLTARATLTHKIEGFEIGADDYITKPFNEDLLKSRVKSILKNRSLLHSKFWKKELIPMSELSLTKADEQFMNKLIKIIEENMSSPDLDVNFVCDKLGMSHSVLYKKIKSLTNMSYIEFVRDFKLKTAKKLIEEQNFSVKDACYHVGYTDRKYFSKIFKKHFGKPPSYFQKKD